MPKKRGNRTLTDNFIRLAVDTGKLLGFEMLDHVIAGDGTAGYFRLRMRGCCKAQVESGKQHGQGHIMLPGHFIIFPLFFH